MDARTATRLALIGTALTLGACDAQSEEADLQFRDASADGHISINLPQSQGTTDPDDGLIWDLIDGESGAVNTGPASNTGLSPDGDPIMIMIESQARLVGVNPDGSFTICHIETYDKGSVLYDDFGNALLSSWQNKIYAGDRRELTGGQIHASELYKVTNDQIRDSQDPSQILATASLPLQDASGFRMVTIGALAEGYCGGDGLP